MQGNEVEKLDLSPAVFEAEVNTNCVRAAANRQLARQRQGTAMTKTRGMVSGGGTKPWKQKGTGRARAGSNRSPLWRGGATLFGPQPRQYGGSINRKVTRKAILSCLSGMLQDSRLMVVDKVEFDAPKTKQVNELLKALKIDDGRRVLIITDKTNENLALSARNLPQVDVINCDNLNVIDLGTHDALVVTSDAVKRLQEVYA
jgi:large subunit ribosomal protein L4